jgi:protoporphyrinogen oxidase
MFSARDKSASAEHLGHVAGGYRSILEKLREQVEQSGGSVRTSTAVAKIEASSNGRIEITSNQNSESFDQVVCTSPVNVLERIIGKDLLETSNTDASVEYLGVVCVVLITKESLSPYYVINVADDTIPFTGVIGMSNVVVPENTGGYHMTYLPQYMLSTDAEMDQPDEYFATRFVDGLVKMFPDFDRESIVDTHVTRAVKVQPLQVLNYSELVPSATTRHDNLFVLNTSQFVNATLNNNEVIGAVNRFYDSHRHRFTAKTEG